MGLALAGALSAVSAQLVVNVTPSLPRGLYWRRPVAALAVGDVVEVTAPDRWIEMCSPLPETLRHGPLLKHVAAIAGTTVCWTPEAMTVPTAVPAQRWPILPRQAPTITIPHGTPVSIQLSENVSFQTPADTASSSDSV